jgi:hypothetical protein
MQDLNDMTGLDDSAVSFEPATWICCACTWENKPSYLVCEACCSERAALDDYDAVPEEDEAIDKWECSTCTFKNEPLLLCCEICNRTRTSHQLEAVAVKPNKAAPPAIAALPTSTSKSVKRPASSTCAAPPARKALEATSGGTAGSPRTVSKSAIQHRVTGKEAAAPAQSDSYCTGCSGYFMTARALSTHECAANFERIGEPEPELPLVLTNFVSVAEEESLLSAVGADYTELDAWEYGMCGSHNLTRRYGRWTDSKREDFPKAVIDIVVKRMQSVPQLRGWAPDNVSVCANASNSTAVMILFAANIVLPP